MKTLYEKALEVQQLLSRRDRWTTGMLAMNRNGYGCNVLDPTACKFCLVGAIAHVEGVKTGDTYGKVAQSDLGHLVKQVIYGIEGRFAAVTDRRTAAAGVIYDYNDDHSYEEVMEVVNTAVAVAKGAE